MNIYYQNNRTRQELHQKEAKNIQSSLYHFFKHASFEISPDTGLHYYHFQAKKTHVLQATYQDSFVKLVSCFSGQAHNNFRSRNSYYFREGQSILYKVEPDEYPSLIQHERAIEVMHVHIPQTMFAKYAEAVPALDSVLHGKKIESPVPFINRSVTHQLNQMSCQPGLQKLYIEQLITDHLFQYCKTLRPASVSKKESDLLAQAKWILDTAADFMTLADLSRQTGLNVGKLKAGFQKLYRTSVYQYQKDLRLAKAYTLLKDTDMTLTEIVNVCGYESVGSFSNAFLKKFTMRPSRLR